MAHALQEVFVALEDELGGVHALGEFEHHQAPPSWWAVPIVQKVSSPRWMVTGPDSRPPTNTSWAIMNRS